MFPFQLFVFTSYSSWRFFCGFMCNINPVAYVSGKYSPEGKQRIQRQKKLLLAEKQTRCRNPRHTGSATSGKTRDALVSLCSFFFLLPIRLAVHSRAYLPVMTSLQHLKTNNSNVRRFISKESFFIELSSFFAEQESRKDV